MGLLNTFGSLGKQLKGLLSDEAFTDRLAQAQAFANGDHVSAARIGRDIRQLQQRASSRHAGVRWEPGQPEPAGPNLFPGAPQFPISSGMGERHRDAAWQNMFLRQASSPIGLRASIPVK